MTGALEPLGADFTAAMADYREAQSQLAALQHEADRTAADAGLVYGSTAWSAHRFAVTGRTVHHVNELYEKLDDLAQAIAPTRATTLVGLLIKARAHQFTGNSAAIITEIEALSEAGNQEAAETEGLPPACRHGTATCGNQRCCYDVANSKLPARQHDRIDRPNRRRTK